MHNNTARAHQHHWISHRGTSKQQNFFGDEMNFIRSHFPTHVFQHESILNPRTAFGRVPLQIGLLQLRP